MEFKLESASCGGEVDVLFGQSLKSVVCVLKQCSAQRSHQMTALVSLCSLCVFPLSGCKL